MGGRARGGAPGAALAAVAPFLLVLGIPTAPVHRYWRRTRPRPVAPAEEAEPEPAGAEEG
ncbi:hypothetical protein ACFWIQ_31685 [Kitasatospora sp. NPDC127059]|uniref:hypothetical protein n=1 Tax=unclassified Kitasatospora TaxID=2633591 RepID=UPI003649021D